MQARRSLSPAQIKYFKVSPKLLNPNSEHTRKIVESALMEKYNCPMLLEQTGAPSIDVKKIAKGSVGEFEKTVRNFGVLMNKNFGSETTQHQIQKFGSRVKKLNEFMVSNTGTVEEGSKKAMLMQKVKDRSDGRTFIKAIYEHSHSKLYVTMKSFELEVIRPSTGSQGLPLPYLKLLVEHVNSSRLVMVLESALKIEGNQIVVEYEKVEAKALSLKNNEVKYHAGEYDFERLGQELRVVLPVLEIVSTDLNYSQTTVIDNADIMKIVETNFGNVHEVVSKYLDLEDFSRHEEAAHAHQEP